MSFAFHLKWYDMKQMAAINHLSNIKKDDVVAASIY